MKKTLLLVVILLSANSFSQNFSLVGGTRFVGTADGSTHLVDIDGDGDLDFFNTGRSIAGTTSFGGIAQLYKNDGKGIFYLVTGTPFPGLEEASSAFADLDNDQDFDLILTGKTDISGGNIANMYLNDGKGNFSLVIGTPFLGVNYGDVVIADLDNDTDLDVIISGINSGTDNRIAVVYKNNGLGVFSVFTNSPAFDLINEGDVDVADTDGDGDLDLLVSGTNTIGSATSGITSLFLNEGTGVFTKDVVASTLFRDVRDGDADIADIDRDGDLDILVNGIDGTTRVASLYINNGMGTFTLAIGTPFVGANAGTVDFVDLDSDGDMDVILSGFETASSSNRRVRIYKNNGSGTFTQQTETITGINNSDIAIGDVNGDNKLDIIINGFSNARIAELYLNIGIKMPALFTDNMVLQRDKPIKIYGEVEPNLAVEITFDNQIYNTQCNDNGKFSIFLPAKSASTNSYTLAITANNETITYKNVVIGDVYLCAGQSNMAFLVSRTNPDQIANATADATYPNLRYFEVARVVAGGALLNNNDKPWTAATPNGVLNWSAVAYFVGRDLHNHLNVPIGLINLCNGGSTADAFISPQAFESDPVLNSVKRTNATGVNHFYQSPSSLYAKMVTKVSGFPIKAVLWYQGEANTEYWQNYKTIFKGLIKDWRTQFNEPNLPWLFVQLPAHDPSNDETKLNWAKTRDAQLQVSKEDSNTGMVVAIDLGDAADIHPTNKLPIAQRMTPHIKALVYGEQITHKSPVYQSHTVQDSEMIISFENIGQGLKTIKSITEFEIAATDKVYKPAAATLLDDNRVKLKNANILSPVYVRYAFRNFTSASIFTKDNISLPLTPFTTESTTNLSNTDFDYDNEELKVYPNPTKSFLNIYTNTIINKIEIFDILGKQVFKGKFVNKLDTSFLKSGVYFLKTDSNQIAKFFKE